MSNLFFGKRVAQCWYSASDYEQVKARMKDGHKLPDKHADWLAGAEQREQQVRSHGGTPVRVAFDLAEFLAFCAHFKIAVDTNARQKFAALKSQMDAESAQDPAPGTH